MPKKIPAGRADIIIYVSFSRSTLCSRALDKVSGMASKHSSKEDHRLKVLVVGAGAAGMVSVPSLVPGASLFLRPSQV